MLMQINLDMPYIDSSKGNTHASPKSLSTSQENS
jgi:hypothetical protein